MLALKAESERTVVLLATIGEVGAATMRRIAGNRVGSTLAGQQVNHAQFANLVMSSTLKHLKQKRDGKL